MSSASYSISKHILEKGGRYNCGLYKLKLSLNAPQDNKMTFDLESFLKTLSRTVTSAPAPHIEELCQRLNFK